MPTRILLLLSLLLMMACEKSKTNQISRVPNLNFSWSSDIVYAKDPIKFRSTASSFHENNLTWLVNGTIHTQFNPIISFPKEGTYPVTLKMTDDPDNSVTKNVTVLHHKEYYSYRGLNVVGENINFFTVGVEDNAHVTWDFGDGTTGTGHNPTHTYTQEGNYTIQLTVDGAPAHLPHYISPITLTIIKQPNAASRIAGGRVWQITKKLSGDGNNTIEQKDQLVTIVYKNDSTVSILANDSYMKEGSILYNKASSNSNKAVFGNQYYNLTHDIITGNTTYYSYNTQGKTVIEIIGHTP